MAGPLEVLATLRKAYGDQAAWWPVDRDWHAAQGTDPRFEICVGAILTQNTTWANVERAVANLRDRRLLDPRRLNRAPLAEVAEAIRPAGSYNRKAEYVRTFARYVANLGGGLDELFGRPPAELRKLLLSFTGIGDETADCILVYAAGVPSFVVDAYTRRLTQRLGIGTGQEPYADLQRLWGARLLPTAKAHAEAHALIVEHAKQRCVARLPRCPSCPLERLCTRVGVDPQVYTRGL
jgi:endonuclease III related protein